MCRCTAQDCSLGVSLASQVATALDQKSTMSCEHILGLNFLIVEHITPPHIGVAHHKLPYDSHLPQDYPLWSSMHVSSSTIFDEVLWTSYLSHPCATPIYLQILFVTTPFSPGATLSAQEIDKLTKNRQ